MLKYKIIIAILSGLLVLVSVAWVTGWPWHYQKAAFVEPASTATATPGRETASATMSQLAVASPSGAVSSSAAPSVTPALTAVPTPTQTAAAPTNTPSPTAARTPSPTHTPSPAHTPSPTATPAPTATPEPTSSFSYSVYNDDGVAPAGFTIVYVKITPGGSYHVMYDGSTITKTKSGSGYITYYTTVEKLEDGNYRSHVHVTAD